MKHKHRHIKQAKHLNRKLKRIAVVAAGAAILSTAMLPGMGGKALASPVSATGLETAQKAASTARATDQTPTTYDIKLPPPPPQAPQESMPAPPATKAPETKPAAAPAENKETPKAQQPQAPAQPAAEKPTANAPSNYQKVLDVVATAYAPGPHDNGPWGDKTHLGTQVRPGVIAVDPNVIPLGSRVYIQYPDGSGQYAVAEDTGGAIKGNRIDIAKWTVAEAEKFGIQRVKVYVLG